MVKRTDGSIRIVQCDKGHLKRGDTIYVVDYSDSVVAALVGGVLRWLCHQ